jgi:hypothetical protein
MQAPLHSPLRWPKISTPKWSSARLLHQRAQAYTASALPQPSWKPAEYLCYPPPLAHSASTAAWRFSALMAASSWVASSLAKLLAPQSSRSHFWMAVLLRLAALAWQLVLHARHQTHLLAPTLCQSTSECRLVAGTRSVNTISKKCYLVGYKEQNHIILMQRMCIYHSNPVLS